MRPSFLMNTFDMAFEQRASEKRLAALQTFVRPPFLMETFDMIFEATSEGERFAALQTFVRLLFLMDTFDMVFECAFAEERLVTRLALVRLRFLMNTLDVTFAVGASGERFAALQTFVRPLFLMDTFDKIFEATSGGERFVALRATVGLVFLMDTFDMVFECAFVEEHLVAHLAFIQPFEFLYPCNAAPVTRFTHKGLIGLYAFRGTLLSTYAEDFLPLFFTLRGASSTFVTNVLPGRRLARQACVAMATFVDRLFPLGNALPYRALKQALAMLVTIIFLSKVFATSGILNRTSAASSFLSQTGTIQTEHTLLRGHVRRAHDLYTK